MTSPTNRDAREAIVACIREAADRGFEAGCARKIAFRFGDLIDKADAILALLADQPLMGDQGASRDHALTVGVALDGWQTMDTAPRDGSRFLAYEEERESKRYECWWQEDFGHWEGWQDDWDSEVNPSHWMPLPAPPSSAMQTPDAVPGTNPKTPDKGGE